MTFASNLERFGQRAGLILDDHSKISYAAIARKADQLFLEQGAPTRARTPIAIECRSTLHSILGYIGALRHHHPAILVDASLDESLRSRLYARYQISHVLTPNGHWSVGTRDFPPVSSHPELALLLSTSGSTGTPKLVKLSYDNLQSNAESIASYLKLSDAERPITTLPLHYSFGLSVINSHLLVGATILLTTNPVTSRGFWDFARYGATTSISGVPFIYDTLRKIRFERMELPSLRTMTQAGGRLHPELTKWYAELAQQRNQKFFVMYGQTEATARIAYVPPDRLLDKIGSIGIPIPGGHLELRDEDDCLIAAREEVGELCYRGSNVMMGYALNPDDFSHADACSGLLRTGDLGYRDSDGFYYLSGRLGRHIKVFGNRISLDDLEAQIGEIWGNVVVAGQDDKIVLATADDSPELGPLVSLLSKRYHIHHSAIVAMSVPEIPTTSSGKPDYGALLKLANG